MTRFGWTVLVVFVLVVAGFLSVTSFGWREAERRWRQLLPPPAPRTELMPGMLAVPVAGIPRDTIRDSWGDERGGGARAHHGTDIPAPGGTPVLSAAAGRIEKLFQSRLGGRTLYVRSPDGRWVYYYAHLAGYAPGAIEGRAVRPGDPIGFVGDTGDAGPGNTHLHFGVQRMRDGERWWQGRDVNPYPLLAGTAPNR